MALAQALALALVLSACGRQPAPTPGLAYVLQATATAAPAPTTAEEEVFAVVSAESEAVKQQDIDGLAVLWTSDCRAVDAAHTPSDGSDDEEWAGWEAVQHRYLRDVFPFVSEPVASPRTHTIMPSVTVEGDKATVTVFGPDGRTATDRWQLERLDGVWRIVSLTYNLLPLQ